MKCFCTPSSFGCPTNREKECAAGVDHCLLTMKWSDELGKFVETIQDCWQWSDKHKCPDEFDRCHILQESVNSTKTCCCKGELCNNATSIQFVLPPDHGTQFGNNSEHHSVTLMDSTVTEQQSTTFSTLLPYMLLILFALLLISFTILFIRFCRNRVKFVHLKPRFRRSKPCKNCHRLADCPCEHSADLPNELQPLNGMDDLMKLPVVGTGWLAENEVEGLSTMVNKIAKKSQGYFGQLWHGQLVKPCDKLPGVTDVAVKVFSPSQKESWDAEIALFRLPDLAHPNILKYYGADQFMNTEFEPPALELWIVTEYHPLGSLHDYLKQNTISWSELLHIACSMARGLSHLHSETVSFGESGPGVRRIKPSIAHRDLNSRNVLLKSDLTACIADFGLAIRFEPGHLPTVAHPQLGTRRYMAPEVLDGAIQFSRDSYLRIDVYALGLVFWELMSRCHGTDELRLSDITSYRAPFEAELGPTPTIAELVRYVTQEKQRPKFRSDWKNYPSMCLLWETVEECWDQDAEARLSAGCVTERISALLRQPWSGRIPMSVGLSHPPEQCEVPVPVRPDVPRSGPFSFPVPSTSLMPIVAPRDAVPP